MWYLENIIAYLLGKIYFMKWIIKNLFCCKVFKLHKWFCPIDFFKKQNIFPIKTAKNNLKNFSSFSSSKEIEFVVPPTVSQSVASASYLGPTPVGSRWDGCGLICGLWPVYVKEPVGKYECTCTSCCSHGWQLGLHQAWLRWDFSTRGWKMRRKVF